MTTKRLRLTRPEPAEAQILKGILQMLAMHPKVAWHARMNVGAGKVLRKGGVSQFMRWGFPGCSDVLGQMRDGRVIAIEAKRPSGEPTPEQIAFLACVRANNGVALVARSVEDVLEALKQ